MRKLKCQFCGIEFDAKGPRKFCDLCKDMIAEVRKRKHNREKQEARRRESEILAEAWACAGQTGGRSRRRGSLGAFVYFAPDLDGCRVEWRGRPWRAEAPPRTSRHSGSRTPIGTRPS